MKTALHDIFDTHAHYDDEAFDGERDALLTQLPRQGIGRIVNVGASLASCVQCLDLAEKYDYVYAAVGVHPSETAELGEENFEGLKKMCLHPRCVAVGEIGLDYHWPEPGPGTQKAWFVRQLALAREIGKPVVIHSRDACQDTLDVMKAEKCGEIGGVIHCYAYSKETAREYLDMDFFFGIGGVLTFKNARKLREAAAYIPLDKLVIETDCPYLAPEPNRGKRNSSLNLPYVVAELAQIKGVDEEEIRRATWRNACRLYRMEQEI